MRDIVIKNMRNHNQREKLAARLKRGSRTNNKIVPPESLAFEIGTAAPQPNTDVVTLYGNNEEIMKVMNGMQRLVLLMVHPQDGLTWKPHDSLHAFVMEFYKKWDQRYNGKRYGTGVRLQLGYVSGNYIQSMKRKPVVKIFSYQPTTLPNL